MPRSPAGNSSTPRSPLSAIHHSFGEVSGSTPDMEAGSSAIDEEEEEETEEEEEKFRVCILGSNDVGKTALAKQFHTSEYMNAYDASQGKKRQRDS